VKPVPPSAKPPPLWVAWRKGPGRWYRVGESGTEAGAWGLIWKAMEDGPRHGAFSSCVLKQGEKP
jgi:hypothetical protein